MMMCVSDNGQKRKQNWKKWKQLLQQCNESNYQQVEWVR